MFVDSQIADVVLRGTVLATAGVAWIVLLVRIVGLRSFSKMTNYDFVMTLATGSLLANGSQASDWTSFTQSMLAIATLFAVQVALSRARMMSPGFENLLENQPTLLMRDGEFLDDALASCRMTRSDLAEKLRMASVTDYTQVRAVILETTGDVSVIQGATLQTDILKGVAR